MNEQQLLKRITINPSIFGGKPIIRGRRLAVEHVMGMLAAGDTIETILEGYPWLEPEDIQACLIYAYRLVGLHEKAVASFKKAINQNPEYFLAWIYLTATYSQMGREEEARVAASKVEQFNPRFIVVSYAKRLPYKNQDHIKTLIASLHKAGLK